MDSKLKEIIVIDVKSIYVVAMSEDATKDDIFAAYMQVSSEGWRTSDGEPYVYCTTMHSSKLYSIRREIEKPEKTLGFILVDIDIANWWANAYPVIEQIANVTGAVTGIAAITSAAFLFIKWIRSKNITKEKEYTWIQNILRNDSWNVSLLSQELSMTEEETKKLLKGFGYVWDSHRMLYIATENTEKLRNVKSNKKL